eukprot:Nk52_evm4s116 gene=Nk52_evmTU4s116
MTFESVWSEHRTPEGRIYFYNAQTQQSVWERPHELSGSPSSNTSGGDALGLKQSQPDSIRVEEKKPGEEKEGEKQEGDLHNDTKGKSEGEGEVYKQTKGEGSMISGEKSYGSGSSPTNQSLGRSPATTVPVVYESLGDWKEHTTADGKKYYYNVKTRATSWTLPVKEKKGVVPATTVEQNKSSNPLQLHKDQRHDDVGKASSNEGSEERTTMPSRGAASAVDKASLGNPKEDTVVQEKKRENEPQKESAPSARVVPAPVVCVAPHTREECREAFLEMLRDHNVTSSCGWERIMPILVKDGRYSFLRTLAERKAAFLEYQAAQKLIEEEEAKKEMEMNRTQLVKVFEDLREDLFIPSKSGGGSMVWWKEMCRMLEGHPLMSKLGKRNVQAVYEQFVKDHEGKCRERQNALCDRNDEKFEYLLTNVVKAELSTCWKDALKAIVESEEYAEDPILKEMGQYRRLQVFENFMGRLQKKEQVKRVEKRKSERTQQRKNREQFWKVLKRLRKDPEVALGVDTKWKEIFKLVKDDESFVAMVGQPGSSPLDLFKFFLENLLDRRDDDKLILKDILKTTKYSVQVDDTLEKFMEEVRSDPKGRISKIDPFNLEYLYKRCIRKAKEKIAERERHARKKIAKRLKGSLQKELQEYLKANDSLLSDNSGAAGIEERATGILQQHHSILETMGGLKDLLKSDEFEKEMIMTEVKEVIQSVLKEIDSEDGELSEGEIKPPAAKRTRLGIHT